MATTSAAATAATVSAQDAPVEPAQASNRRADFACELARAQHRIAELERDVQLAAEDKSTLLIQLEAAENNTRMLSEQVQRLLSQLDDEHRRDLAHQASMPVAVDSVEEAAVMLSDMHLKVTAAGNVEKTLKIQLAGAEEKIALLTDQVQKLLQQLTEEHATHRQSLAEAERVQTQCSKAAHSMIMQLHQCKTHGMQLMQHNEDLQAELEETVNRVEFLEAVIANHGIDLAAERANFS